MSSPRLNRLALRAGRTPWRPEGDPRPPPDPGGGAAGGRADDSRALRDAILDAALTRRRLLALSATGAGGLVTRAPGVRAFAATPFGDFDLDVVRDRAIFSVGGTVRWIVDAARFAGRPVLSTLRAGDGVTLALSGARLPGSDLAADLTARITRTGDRWRLALAWPALDLALDVDFVDWLSGRAEAAGRVRLAARFGGADEGVGTVAASLSGRAGAWLTPGWTLRLSGRGIARVDAFGHRLAADDAVVALASPGTPSLTAPPAPRRTLLSVARGGRAWRLAPDFDLPGGAHIAWRREMFDDVHVEAGEDAAGRRTSVALAEATSAGRSGGAVIENEPSDPTAGPVSSAVAVGRVSPAALVGRVSPAALVGRVSPAALVGHVSPGGAARDLSGRPLDLPIVQARYVARAGGDGGERALFARLDAGATAWLAAPGGVALALGEPEGDPALEISASAGLPADVRLRPALRHLVLPLDGALTRTRLAAGARAAFAWDDAPSADRTGPDDLCTVVVLRDRVETITQTRGLTLEMQRPDDLMALDLDFDNLLLRPGESRGDPQRLVLADAGRPARIVIQFPPQHITERASLDEGQNPLVAPTPPVPAAPASPSRLAFQVSNAMFPAGIPYTLGALLDWSQFDPVPGPVGTVRRPTAFETALVVPYRLILHPDVADKPAWAHARGPVVVDGRSELWHTRLGVEGADGSQEVAGEDKVDERRRPHLRAVWTESFDPDEPLFLGCNHALVADPFAPMSLTPNDRRDITMLSGTGSDRIDADRLFLSPLGAWLDVSFNRSAGNNNCQTPLESWIHRAAMGRDYFVRVVYRGNLMPFGHRAALIKLTERKFETNAAGDVVAALWQRQFIVVREPSKTFNSRRLPFRSVRLATLVTPSLRLSSPQAKLGSLAADGNGGLWPIVLVDGADRDFPFQVVATDWDGQTVEWTMPMAWLAEGASAVVARDAYNAEVGARVLRPMGGQKVAYAAGSAGGGGGDGGGAATSRGDTRLETLALTFGVDASGPLSNPFAPHMRAASAIVEPLKDLLGERTPVDLEYEDTFLQHGFDAAQNAGEIFLKLQDKLPIDFGGGGQGDRGGGLVTPNFDISGLSRKLGLAGGDLAALAGGTFDPADFLDVSNLANKAKILGYDILDKLLAVIPPAEFGDGESVPRITTKVDVPAQLSITEVYWSPAITPFPPFAFDQGGTTDFVIRSTLRAKLDAGGASAETDIVCELTFFAIDLVAIKLTLDSLKFTAGSGKATSVVPVIADVAFGGPLQFVEKLKDVLSSDVLGVGPKIDVTPSGILAGISVALPSVAVGVFSLENIRLSAALNIPLTGDPVRFRFAFCERESPFILTVSAFGGGGYLAVHLGADGLAKLEMALEFGASLSMSIGIASGSCGVMAGIYLELTSEGGQTDVLLTGYLRCWGELSLLGLITISAEFYLGFTYDSARNSCRGQAKLTVKVEILFFEKTFTLTVEREFGGAGGGGFFLADPAANGDRATDRALTDGIHRLGEAPPGGIRFVDLFAEPDWAVYCDAFA